MRIVNPATGKSYFRKRRERIEEPGQARPSRATNDFNFSTAIGLDNGLLTRCARLERNRHSIFGLM